MKASTRRNFLALGLAGAGLSVRRLRADILVPGAKFVSHKMKFENLKEYRKDYKFFFLPLNDTVGPRGMAVQNEFNESGVVAVSGINPVEVAGSKGLYLVAVPVAMLDAAGSVPIRTLLNPPSGVLKSERLIDQIRAVPKSDKDEFWTVYHVKIVDGQLQAGLIRHDEPMKRDRVKTSSVGSGSVAAISSVLAGGVLALRFRHRPTE